MIKVSSKMRNYDHSINFLFKRQNTYVGQLYKVLWDIMLNYKWSITKHTDLININFMITRKLLYCHDVSSFHHKMETKCWVGKLDLTVNRKINFKSFTESWMLTCEITSSCLFFNLFTSKLNLCNKFSRSPTCVEKKIKST